MPERLAKPSKTASFKEYMEYYLERKNWSQNKLAIAARLNQSQVNKIINGTVYTVAGWHIGVSVPGTATKSWRKQGFISEDGTGILPASTLHQTYQEV